jgi:hypothetical protein
MMRNPPKPERIKTPLLVLGAQTPDHSRETTGHARERG